MRAADRSTLVRLWRATIMPMTVSGRSTRNSGAPVARAAVKDLVPQTPAGQSYDARVQACCVRGSPPNARA
jgi:hypothetical protein